MRSIIILLALLIATPAIAAKSRQCAVRSADNVVVGCWNIDPQVYPAPEGTFWQPDPNSLAGPDATWNGTTFVPRALTPEEQAAKDASDAKEARENDLRALSDVQDLANRLKTATPAQIDTWVDNNMNNLAQARTVMKALLKVLAYALRT